MNTDQRIIADLERQTCMTCAARRAATRLGLAICVICAGIVSSPNAR